MNDQRVMAEPCEWASYEVEPPNEKCDLPARLKNTYRTREGRSVELWLCAKHDRQMRGQVAARRDAVTA